MANINDLEVNRRNTGKFKIDEEDAALFRRAVLVEGITKIAHLAKLFHCTPATVKDTARRLGLVVGPAAWKTDGTDPNAEARGAEPENLLPSDILGLFDLLLPFFKPLDEGEEPDRSTWIAWRVFLAAAFGLPCPIDEADGYPAYPGVHDETVTRGAAACPPGATNLQIFAACTSRAQWPSEQARRVALCVGRRGGKSFVTAIIGIFLACCKKYKLGIGEQGMVMILARDREQAGVIRRYVREMVRAVPQLAAMLKGEPTQKLIEFTNDITIEIRAASDAGTRGYTVVGALCDEIAFWPTDANSARQDKEIIRAILPAMSRIKGSMLVMLSSPYAKRGEFFEQFRKGFGKDDQTRVFVWQADSLTMHPTNDPDLLSEIKDAYDDDPESAKAEYGAWFRSDLEAIYSKEALDACAVAGRIELGYTSGVQFRAFVDPSGGSSDSFTLAIGYTERRKVDDAERPAVEEIEILACLREIKAPFSPEQAVEELCGVLKSYKVSSVIGDRYAGEWPREQFRKRGINYVLSEKTRSELYLDMLPLVNSQRCELLDTRTHLRMTNQFANLERRPGRGKDVVDHPPNSHDDVANAVAGVLVCTNPGSQYRIRRPDVARR